MRQAQAEPVRLARTDTRAPQGLELRHLRYLVAVAEAGTLSRPPERVFIPPPTPRPPDPPLGQPVRTPPLGPGPGGVRATPAGAVAAGCVGAGGGAPRAPRGRARGVCGRGGGGRRAAPPGPPPRQYRDV